MVGSYTLDQIAEKFGKTKTAVYSATARANGIRKITGTRLYDAESVDRYWGHLLSKDQEASQPEGTKELPETSTSVKVPLSAEKLAKRVSDLSQQLYDLEFQLINAQKTYQHHARIIFGGVREDNKRYHGVDEIASILKEVNAKISKLQAAHIELGKHVGFYQNDGSLESQWTVI